MNAAYQRRPPADWPGAEFGEQRDVGGVRWYYQRRGAGVGRVLFLHGTGASSHSWHRVAEHLAQSREVLIPDLPGQGFSEVRDPSQITLEGMAKALRALLEELGFAPDTIVGHSAGAAIACCLCLRGAVNPRHLVSMNGALLPFGRAAAPVMSSAAQFLASSRMLPYIVAAHSLTRYPIERMLRSTGSMLDPQMARCYRTLLGSPGHVSGTLRMMANWDLNQLERNLHRLEPELWLLVGTGDEVVAPQQAYELHERLPDSKLFEFPDLGHLAHEERPDLVSGVLDDLKERD